MPDPVKSAKASEASVARPVVEWLRSQGHVVHQEVTTVEGRADIVAVTPLQHLWILECKTALSFDLLDQAQRQQWCAHYVSVVVPETLTVSRGRAVAMQWLRDAGIGLITVSRQYMADEEPRVVEVLQPRTTLTAHSMARHRIDGMRRFAHSQPLKARAHAIARLRDFLSEETQTFAEAGNDRSRYWSYARETQKAIRAAASEPQTAQQISATLARDHRLPQARRGGKLYGQA